MCCEVALLEQVGSGLQMEHALDALYLTNRVERAHGANVLADLYCVSDGYIVCALPEAVLPQPLCAVADSDDGSGTV